MSCLLRNALEQGSGRVYRLILAEHGLYVIEAGHAGFDDRSDIVQTLEAGSYIGFARIEQMDYDDSLLHLDSKGHDYRFTFPDTPTDEVERFVDSLHEALAHEHAAVPMR